MITKTVEHFEQLPGSAMVDVKTVAAILGRSPSSIWRDARTGKLPAPIKTGAMTTRWKVEAIRKHLEELEDKKADAAADRQPERKRKTKLSGHASIQASFSEPELQAPEGCIGIHGPRQIAYRTPALYALFHGEELVYIGKSDNPQARIGQHAMNTSIYFDNFVVMPTLPHLIDIEERRLINLNKPKHNQQHTKTLQQPLP